MRKREVRMEEERNERERIEEERNEREMVKMRLDRKSGRLVE